MKKLAFLFTSVAGLMLLASTTSVFAANSDQSADTAKPKRHAREVTITGTAECAKCTLKETDKCQTVIETERNGRKVKYYLANNDVAKNFHENICKAPEKVTAKGTFKRMEGGKREFTATEIKLVKADAEK